MKTDLVPAAAVQRGLCWFGVDLWVVIYRFLVVLQPKGRGQRGIRPSELGSLVLVGSVADLIADLYGASLGDFIVERRRRAKRTEVELSEYGLGVTVRLRASAYGLSRFLPSTWIGGILEVTPGLAVWHGGYFRESGGVPISAKGFEPVHLRSITGRETWSITQNHVVLVGVFEGRRMELAVLMDEIPLVLDALGAKHLLD